jgi:hypothetical protein
MPSPPWAWGGLAEAVGVADDGFQFVQRVLRGARIVAERQHAAGGAYLDDVGAVLDVAARDLERFIHAIGHAERGDLVFGRVHGVVAVAAGDAEWRAGGEDARAGHVAVVDGVAQADVGVVVGADVADGGEAGAQRGQRILGADQRHARHRLGDQAVAGVFGRAGDVGVGVDQAGQQGLVAQVDDCALAGMASLLPAAVMRSPLISTTALSTSVPLRRPCGRP